MRGTSSLGVLAGGTWLLALTACGPVGPDHETPEMTLPRSFSQGGVTWKRESPDSQPRPQEWWKAFGDRSLTDLVTRSLERNQDLAAAAARLKQARELSNQARSLYFPGINLGTGLERSKRRIDDGRDDPELSDTLSVPADMSYELDVWGKVRRQVEAATASEAAARETLHAMRLSLAGEVAQTYWALRALDADRSVYDRTLEARRKALGLLVKRRDAGTLSGLDLARAETEVATAEADRIQLDRRGVELVNALAVLCGDAATVASLPVATDLPEPPEIPVTVPAELLRQRPDIRAAERRVAAANAEIGIATAAFYPAVTLGASGGLDSETFADLFEASSLVWSIGSRAVVPLTGQRWLRSRRAAAVAAHEAASAEYRQTVLDAMREVENALQGSAILRRRETAQNEVLEASRKTFELASRRYRSGLVGFLEVVDAERVRLDAERSANAVRAERLAVAVALAKALGGEW